MRFWILTNVAIIILSFILIRCANISQPTGGPKDIAPPQLLSTYPTDQTLNFNDNRIQFTFDEPVKVEEVKKQIIITPPIDEERYNIKVKNNIVTFQLKDRLQANTTYTVNLGEAVRDITENNRAKNIKIGFSTGDYIDSLSVSGKVTNLLRGNPMNNVLVGLYRADDTLDIFNKRPLYFTKTDSSGTYQLTNIKNDSYKIYAFFDKNENLKNEPATEAYGFKENILHLDSSMIDVNIRLYKRDVSPLKVLSSRPDGQYFLIKLNKWVKDYTLTAVDGQTPLIHNLVDDNKTIRVYNTLNVDSLQANLLAIDTLNKDVTEEVMIKFIQSRKPKENFNHSFHPTESDKIKESFQVEITFTKPVIAVIPDSMFFQYDSLNILPIIPDSDFTWNKLRDKVILKKTLNKNLAIGANRPSEANPRDNARTLSSSNINEGSVKLFFGENSFISVENDSSKLIQKTYKFLNPQETGTIEGRISSEHDRFTIQLLDKNFKLIEEIENKRNYKFENVKPGEYRIRVLIDNDGDGRWFPGDIKEFREPEDVHILEEILTIRANWERKDVDISF